MSKPATRRVVRKPTAKPAARPTSRPARAVAQVPLLFQFMRRHGGIVLGLTLLVVGVHILFGPKGLLAMRRGQMEVDRLQGEIQKMNAENQRMTEHVKALKSDPRLIERIAREQMGMTRPGERVYRIAPQQETTSTAPPR
jgi:cell division protein FtsB